MQCIWVMGSLGKPGKGHLCLGSKLKGLRGMSQLLPLSTYCTSGDFDRYHLTDSSQDSHCEHPNFTDEETETLSDQLACPRLQSWSLVEPRFNPDLWL